MAGFFRRTYHQLSREDVRLEFGQHWASARSEKKRNREVLTGSCAKCEAGDRNDGNCAAAGKGVSIAHRRRILGSESKLIMKMNDASFRPEVVFLAVRAPPAANKTFAGPFARRRFLRSLLRGGKANGIEDEDKVTGM